jgi:hypothetical protein
MAAALELPIDVLSVRLFVFGLSHADAKNLASTISPLTLHPHFS